MTLVGFKRLKIQIFGKDGVPIPDAFYTIEGKANEGATTTAEISGLSRVPKVVSGSNIAYWSSRKGVGEVKAEFGLLDMPETVADQILGYQVGEDKITRIGDKTEAPYCAVMLESENMQDEKALFGLYKGTFSRDTIKAESLKVDGDFEPEAETFTFTALGSDKEGPAKGNYAAKYFGDDEEAITTITEEVFGKKA